jgi:hypothetical protein
MWYIYTMEYSAIKKNEIMSFTGKWMELPFCLMPSKISQTKISNAYVEFRL